MLRDAVSPEVLEAFDASWDFGIASREAAASRVRGRSLGVLRPKVDRRREPDYRGSRIRVGRLLPDGSVIWEGR